MAMGHNVTQYNYSVHVNLEINLTDFNKIYTQVSAHLLQP